MAISNVKTPAGGVQTPVLNKPSVASGAADGLKSTGQAPGSSPAAATGQATAVRAASQGYAKAAATPTAKDAANVTISPKARELSLARAVVDETPDVRADKVAEFKARIASGEYKPDAGRIADGMLKEAIKDELSKKPETALE
jgi:negative regulator of flagellin synthesis FlgM